MAVNFNNPLFYTYCYGSVEIKKLRKGDSTMWLSLEDSAGVHSDAIYHGCVYWRLEHAGLHLSLVLRVTASELLANPDSPTIRALQKNASDVPALLREWEAEGLSFFIHLGKEPDEEFLVVAESLEYRETY